MDQNLLQVDHRMPHEIDGGAERTGNRIMGGFFLSRPRRLGTAIPNENVPPPKPSGNLIGPEGQSLPDSATGNGLRIQQVS
jgi:hypothetical protein